MSGTQDQYSRFDYRRMIAWPDRIRREWPFIEAVLKTAPAKRILELGSGTGEHARYLASKGFDVTGVDSSESMIEKSLEAAEGGDSRFVQGDISSIGSLVSGDFGAAICLGNTLPHLRGWKEIASLADGLRSVLLPESPLIVQILNYDRIIRRKERFLPLDFRPDPDGPDTIVYLRLMDPRDDGTVVFVPSTLRLNSASEEPLELIGSRRVELHGWRRGELEAILGERGFDAFEAFGSFDRAPFDADESRDLILVARRA